MDKLVTYKFMFFAFLSVLFVVLDLFFACGMYHKSQNLAKYTKVANNYYDIYNLFFVGTLINWISSNLTWNIIITMVFILAMFSIVVYIKFQFEVKKNQVLELKWWYSLGKDICGNIVIAFLLGIFTNVAIPSILIIVLIILSFILYMWFLNKAEK